MTNNSIKWIEIDINYQNNQYYSGQPIINLGLGHRAINRKQYSSIVVTLTAISAYIYSLCKELEEKRKNRISIS